MAAMRKVLSERAPLTVKPGTPQVRQPSRSESTCRCRKFAVDIWCERHSKR